MSELRDLETWWLMIPFLRLIVLVFKELIWILGKMSRGPLLVLLCVCLAGVATAVHPKHVRYFEKVASLEKNMEFMARQLMMQQFYAEEQVRSDGDSGLKRVRIRSQGTQPYHSANHADSDTVRTLIPLYFFNYCTFNLFIIIVRFICIWLTMGLKLYKHYASLFLLFNNHCILSFINWHMYDVM